jgi:regulation of enolase protein 1 (concanavalin A-like superfamily)
MTRLNYRANSRRGFTSLFRLGVPLLIFTVLSSAHAALPAGWNDADIGSPADAGSASSVNGLWTVAGGGGDIWGAADQFNFASQPFDCDGAIMAEVTSVQNTDPGTGWSKAGVMFRNDTAAGAVNAFMTATATEGVCFQVRTTMNAASVNTTVSGINPPVWVKVVRSSDQFSGYYSYDGINWIQVGSTTTIEMAGNALAGLAVCAHNNSALNTSTFTNVSLTTPTFGVYRELWTNLSSSAGNTLAALTNTTDNPNWPSSPVGSYTHVFTNFETEINLNMNYFGQRVRTFVVPPTNGLYTFWIASDDTSQLYLSTNENPAGISAIASQTSYTSSEEWTEFANQQSAQIYLQGGCRYYLEARMQQGNGGENLSVRWQLPNGVYEQPLASVSTAGTVLVPCSGVNLFPGIYSQTTNVTTVENQNATLSILVTNPAPVTYQWFGGSTKLPGATLPVYTVTNANLLLNNGQTFTCVVSNSVGSVTSAPITLNVTRDTTPPVVTQVFNLGLTNVEIVFSKPVSLTTATNLVNYAFTNGLGITGATLAVNNSTVTLTNAPLVYGSNYTVVINNISDLANIPNVIAANTTVSFTASPFAPADIGSPTIPSTVTYTTNETTVSGAGADIGGTSDQFNFQYQPQTANFDVTVALSGLGLSDLWAQAGLMARASLDPASPFAAAVATPGIAGDFFTDRILTNGAAGSTGTFPANYPHTWLRLSRAGNVFTGYGSYDGTNWTQLGSASIVMPARIYLGLATASHNPAQTTTASFVNYGTTAAGSVVATITNPHDVIGPTSRHTPIAFSEIMWKPASRPDGKNLEFLELYNSNPWFQDISGYQITCADVNYTFPPGTQIPGGGYLVVAAAPADIESVYGITNVMGPYNGSLKHSETLQFLDEQTNVLLTLPYTDVYPWPVATAGTGHSLVLANPTYGEGDPRAWDISDVVGGSPGQMDGFTPSPLRSVVINEILPHSENPGVPQFIELYNHSTNQVDISGCILTDDSTTNKFVIPAGTVIGPAGFISFTHFNFTLNGAGETLYFIKPDGSRILDAVQFGPQANGVSFGRWPDGANDFYAFTTNTPGAGNSPILIGNIVINELMYDPISGSDDDQYIELYNQGTNAVNLNGWQFTTGVTFTFPNITIAANGFVVVAKNMTNLFAKYSNLNSGNTVGNYSGKLSHNGELLTLCSPQMLTNTPILVAEDQVTYGIGGRWGEWADGGGSSLELIDPHSNHRLAANWADSDDTAKTVWTNITWTGVLDNGANYDPAIDYAQIGLLDAGECLVDNIQVNYEGTNYVSNGTFDGGLGLTNWSLQGCMVRSSLESTGYLSNYSLHIRSSDKLWVGDNSCEVALLTNNLAAGETVTLSYQARWLHGTPEPLLRLNGNWLEATAVLPVPNNLGTPGLPNSKYITNAGPAMYHVTHNPPLPAAGQPVVVSANVSDPDGIQNFTLYYRLDPAATYTAVPMADNGTGGDAVAGDGVYSATIPGQAANQVVAFYISATDQLGAVTRFPALRPADNEPVRECVVAFGDTNPGGTFGSYHMWLTQTNINRWASLGDLSNEGNDGTLVDGNRVLYDMQGHFSGSPYHQDFDSPVGNLCTYDLDFNADDMLLGVTSFNKIHLPGNNPGDDASLQREQLANYFLRSLGVPWLNRRYVAMYVNGNRRGQLMEDSQVPDSDLVKEHFPNDSGGFLFKMQPWFEMAPFPTGATINFNNNAWCNLQPYTTTGGVKKPARYRYNFEIRRTPDTFSDFTDVFSLVDAASTTGSPNYVANLENMANMENWMRVFAANHAAGNWDSFGAQNAQNLYGYIGALGTKYSLLMWDFNIVFGNSSSWGPGQNLFTYNSEDPSMAAIYSNPTFLRMYWRALQELVNGPLNTAISGPLLTAKYNAFVENGLSVENPAQNIEPWLSQAQSSIASQLAAVNSTNFYVNRTVVSNQTAYVTGTAPVNVDTVLINGVAYPLTWINLINWVVTLPLANGTNQFSVVGVDRFNQPITGDSNTVILVNNGTNTPPAGQVVIDEIMYAPAVENAQFVELYNNSTNQTYDLSGWQLQGSGYTFPDGSLLGPTNYLVLAENIAAYAAAYGATNPVFDIFNGTLPADGLLTLNNSNHAPVAEVAYENQLPWPTNANGTGASLQLIDPRQDNWRVGNWSVTPSTATPSTENSVAASLTPFPSLWINEVQADNLNGITNGAGLHTPWLELYNPGTNAISLNGLYLANNYTNLLQWAFPANARIKAGQFEVIFADTLTNLSTTNELHTSFSLTSGSGSVALTRLAAGSQQQVLDYVDYQNIAANDSYGSYPDGQSFSRQEFFQATPGSANNGSALPPPSFIDYGTVGSVYQETFDSLPDPGPTSVDSSNTVTIAGVVYSLANPYDFAYPVIATGSSGGLGLADLAGWYGTSTLLSRFGATDGDQTTGGQISFGLPNSSNRALGQLATSSTGATAFGVRFINGTTTTLTRMNLQFTGELWRQSSVSKYLQFYYTVDPTGTNTFPKAATAALPVLNISFPTVAADAGGVAVDGTAAVNQTNLSVLDQTITNWPPGAALWLVWEMPNSAAKAQGIAIDNLSFAATVPQPVLLNGQVSTAGIVLNWSGVAGQIYQLQCKTNLTDPSWTPIGSPVTGTGTPLTMTNTSGASSQLFFRLQLVN